MFYDMEKHAVTRMLPFGNMGQISFERLEQLMRDAGELKPNERVTHFAVNAVTGMIRYRIE